MGTEQLSTTTISETGLTNLPKNFDGLSARKQKEIVFNALRDEMIQVTKLAGNLNLLKTKIKQQNALIKNSAEYRSLLKLKKQFKDDARLEDELLIERSGMIKIAKQLGLVSENDLKKMRMIE